MKLNSHNIIGKKECKLSGCYNKCYITIDGFVYDFCGQSHATLYEQQFPQSKYCMLGIGYNFDVVSLSS